ncbi:hypothetical protein CDD82_5437 [Ophiocordyceps australis]|uniref:SUR7 protein n=1 Tax=Ophiocordyceps australis TaxID=1399860 RepID=A0A2C5Y729_9HYPO|nr:hypothetical protein CDD82_5437 [Ophiocordyceps australis]
MVPVTRLAILLPLVFALVSFVLTSIALFSGYHQGTLEDYDVVRLNTSGIGHDLFDGKKDSAKKDGDGKDGEKKDGILGDIQQWWDDTKDGARDKLNDITGDAADKLLDKLGISQWYSLHIMDTCQGEFTPTFNVTNCTSSTPSNRFNLTAVLDHQVSVGPVKINLATLEWPQSLQDKIDLLNGALLGLFVVYVVAMGFCGLSMLASLATFFLPAKRGIVFGNLALASFAALACLIGSIITTIVGSKGVSEINERGERFGVKAARGSKFYIISWIATGLMLGAALFWFGQLLTGRKRTGVKSDKASA